MTQSKFEKKIIDENSEMGYSFTAMELNWDSIP